ncbi:chitodextrinase [Pseudomonas lini]|uniref:fibronectin type III domain-containing protein n=1 Tax=Pseudomonas lini TaxID=163011 RepID=UPI0027871734|nr:fibronectin type III domain-containing protein [Pseudomonas lini]MDQ0124475.1 chitodextrinase [Pseudomonas lini]
MSIQEQNHELQTPNSFLLPPTVSDTENDVLNYNNLTTSPIVKVPPWIGINSQSKLWLHCECTYADGRRGVIELAEAIPVDDATGASTFSCELPLDELAKLGDNTNLVIILMVSNDGTLEKQSFSSIRYNLMFQHPIVLTDYSRWMTDIGTSLEHLKIHDLVLAETHHAGVDQEGAGWPADQWGACQDDSFAYQLKNGIRAFDLRMVWADHGYRFEHSGFHASRRLYHCINAVKEFAAQNPGEIVILDFQKVDQDQTVQLAALEQLLFVLRDHCIPADARDLTIKQIRKRYPGKNVIVAWSLPNPVCWTTVSQTWNKQDLNDEHSVAMHMDDIWGKTQPTGLWSVFACGYDILGPIRFNSSAIHWERFFSRVGSSSYRQPTRGNMIYLDFFAGTGVVDRCINATRDRANKAALTVASGFTVNLIGKHDAQLKWESPSETGRLRDYNIFQNGTYLATVPSHPREYSITGLADGRTYHFQVIANFTDGIGAVAEATLAIPDVTSPSRPYHLRIKTYDFTNPTISFLSWEKSTDNVAVRHYKIYRNHETNPIGTTTDELFQINETSGVTYVVRAVDTSGNYSDSDPLSAIGDLIPPTKPANLEATATYDNTVTLKWDPSSDNVAVAGYQIIRNSTPIGTVDSNVFSETVLDGTYTYKVRALDTSGNFTDSDELRFRIGMPLPSRPTNLKATDYGGKTYIVWDGSTSNDGLFYEIWRNGEPVGKVNHYSGTLSFMTEDVITPWSIGVRARDIAGNFADSETVHNAPSKPTNLRLTTITDNSVTLEWTASSDNVEVTGYQIFRNNDPITTINDTRYTVSGLTSATSYIFKVRALDAEGNFADSDELHVTTPDETAPSKPAHLVATAVTDNSVTLSWVGSIDNVGVTGYQILRNDEVIDTVGSIRYTATGLAQGTTYTFKVRALDAAGNFADSDPLTVQTQDTTGPSKPTNLRTVGLASDYAVLEWNASSDNVAVTGYRIFRNNDPIDMTDITLYLAHGLTDGTSYFFKVRAMDAAGNFADSDELPVTTPDATAPSKPLNLRPTGITGNSVTLEWAASSDNVAVTGYVIFRNNDPITTINNTRYTVSGLTSATSYYFKVRALDAAGNYADSDTLPVKTIDTSGPSKPTNVKATDLMGRTYIMWDGSTSNKDFFYEIRRNGDPVGKVNHHSGTLAFMTEDVVTPWSIVVRAQDVDGYYTDSDPATSP